MATTPELRQRTSGALVACGLWLHVGLVGATAATAGLLQLSDGEANWPWVPLVIFGGVLAAASWRRGLALLEQAERGSAGPSDAPSEPAFRPLHAKRERGHRQALRSSTAIDR